jgi:hypothetical protein
VIRLPFVEKERVERLFIHERFLARLAGMRARLNIPINHRQSATTCRAFQPKYPKAYRPAQSL